MRDLRWTCLTGRSASIHGTKYEMLHPVGDGCVDDGMSLRFLHLCLTGHGDRHEEDAINFMRVEDRGRREGVALDECYVGFRG